MKCNEPKRRHIIVCSSFNLSISRKHSFIILGYYFFLPVSFSKRIKTLGSSQQGITVVVITFGFEGYGTSSQGSSGSTGYITSLLDNVGVSSKWNLCLSAYYKRIKDLIVDYTLVNHSFKKLNFLILFSIIYQRAFKMLTYYKLYQSKQTKTLFSAILYSMRRECLFFFFIKNITTTHV